MPVSILATEQILRRSHKKQSIAEQSLLSFQKNLANLLEKLKDHNREGKQETDVRDFLNDSFYKDKYYINKKETADWVIYNGANDKSKVAVILEMKRTSAKTEMLTEIEVNVKALHELVLYYLRERIENNNHEIKHLIASNGIEWYIFNELWFNEVFYTTAFKKSYQSWKLSGHSTDDFYKQYVKPYIAELQDEIVFCKIDLRDYQKASNRKLSELYKVLSPEHLLKQEIANDANKLNRPFYNELLYILGIEERKAADSNKKIIDRIVPEKWQDGSLIENVINKLIVKDCLRNVKNLESFGENREDQLYSVALELCITWLNRILFLKLLESQLVKYHNDDKSFKFLSYDKIQDFDELSELFFEVLAIPTKDRTESVNKKFGQIPYLNSSLFELSDLEKETISIEDLKDRLEISYFSSSVLVNDNGKPQKGEINTLKYLLEFLDAYRFGASDDEESIKQDKLINAAVLGLIFEKLNGYKDGSFYTPAFITMYMCRETIRRAVVQKFNETNNWGCEIFDDLHEHIEYKNLQERKAYNEQINSIKICDPAVGSGHFLVSALNEMIAIKSELKILQHPNGTRIKDIEVSIDNDELTVYDQNEGQDFNYTVGKGGGLISEKQLLQETLFEEKRAIIENCLFGVDINPKSVKICQLRLWIELLKNAYYKADGELETLPNIDINIKTGNSLVSKYALDEDLSEVFKKQKFSLAIYQDTVAAYKEAKTKESKAEFKNFISEIKEAFRQSVINTDPHRKKQNELYWKLQGLKANVDMFGNKKLSDTELKKQKTDLEKQKQKVDEEIQDIENNKIYRNSFEWRFEFPEVLNAQGDFVGFDVVIGNPPYGVKTTDKYKEFYQRNYKATSDIYTIFIELGLNLNVKNGFTGFIIPVSWLTGDNFISTRNLFIGKGKITIAINLPYNVFEEAYVDTGIYVFENAKEEYYSSSVFEFNPKSKIEKGFSQNLDFSIINSQEWQNEKKLKIVLNTQISTLNKKVYNKGITLYSISTSGRGILADSSDIFKNSFEEETKLLFEGKLNRYVMDEPSSYVIYGDNLKEKPKNDSIFTGERILVRRIISRQFRIMATKTDVDFVSKKDLYVFKITDDKFNLNYILSLLNSSLVSFLKTQGSTSAKKDDFTQLTLSDVRELCIPQISETDQAPFIEIVDEILNLKKADPAADTVALEAEIDKMVYELYELTEEEIAIVEGR